MLIFLLKKNVSKATHIFTVKIPVNLDSVLTKTVNSLTTNELVKLTML